MYWVITRVHTLGVSNRLTPDLEICPSFFARITQPKLFTHKMTGLFTIILQLNNKIKLHLSVHTPTHKLIHQHQFSAQGNMVTQYYQHNNTNTYCTSTNEMSSGFAAKYRSYLTSSSKYCGGINMSLIASGQYIVHLYLHCNVIVV